MSPLHERDRQTLLTIAKGAVGTYLAGLRLNLPDITEGALAEARGVFVSIHAEQNLRGCVGNVQPDHPLYEATARCAVAAAVSDPRFPPVTLPELPLLTFELSVLTMPQRVQDPAEIEVGIHGLIVSKGSSKGLLLPQVPSHFGWDRDRFLAETCIKAGLAPEEWKQGASIYRFTAQVFSER